MVLQSTLLKRFLAGTSSDYFLYLNKVSESEKSEDFKNHSFPKKGIIIILENSLQNLQGRKYGSKKFPFVKKHSPFTF